MTGHKYIAAGSCQHHDYQKRKTSRADETGDSGADAAVVVAAAAAADCVVVDKSANLTKNESSMRKRVGSSEDPRSDYLFPRHSS